MIKFEDLRGKILKAISGKVGDDIIIFTLDNDVQFRLYHEQDCCEACYIEDINGDLEDLIGSEILLAEEVISKDENPEEVIVPDYQDSFTWTFYKLSTIKGSVVFRWYGESNGYYSETVDFGPV